MDISSKDIKSEFNEVNLIHVTDHTLEPINNYKDYLSMDIKSNTDLNPRNFDMIKADLAIKVYNCRNKQYEDECSTSKKGGVIYVLNEEVEVPIKNDRRRDW